LRGADLRSAQLATARNLPADLEGVHYNAATQWPAGADPDRAGAKFHAATLLPDTAESTDEEDAPVKDRPWWRLWG
jgi:hypothetical protein